jgi:hypothetical protein
MIPVLAAATWSCAGCCQPQYEVQNCRRHVVLHVWQRICPCWWQHSQLQVELQEFSGCRHCRRFPARQHRQRMPSSIWQTSLGE